MNRVVICTGKQSQVPYYLDKLFVSVSSIEELCYVMHENAFMLDKDFLTVPLVEWIEKSLKLPDLARELYPLVTHNGNVFSFVSAIMEYVGYYSSEEIKKVEGILKMNVSLSSYEKQKSKADFLFENRHYSLALREYLKLLDMLPIDEFAIKSKIYNNIGCAYMTNYMYSKAKEAFKEAIKNDDNPVAFKNLMVVNRLSMSDDEYRKYLSENENVLDVSNEVEKEYSELCSSFDSSREKHELDELEEIKNRNKNEFYIRMSAIVNELKDDYRMLSVEGAMYDQ